MTVVVMAACVDLRLVGRPRARPRAYFALMLFLTGAIVGVFTAQDLLLFYAFFEAMLIPLYVLIGVWGGPGRMRATLKFVVYTVVGSLLMLASIVVFGLQQGTFDLTQMAQSSSTWLFLGFVIAFAIKSPLFPFHGWLPDAYREAPPEVAAVLSGVVSKAGLYGLLRIAIPKFPAPAHDWRVVAARARVDLARLRLAARVPRARLPRRRHVLVARAVGPDRARPLREQQPRLRRRRAADRQPRADLRVAVPDRGHGRAAHVDRRVCAARRHGARAARARDVLMTVGVIALAVPLSTSFAGEFLILAGVFQQGWAWAVVGAVAIVLAAMYMLRAISAVLHQDVGLGGVRDSALDLRLGELAVVVPLVSA